MGFIAYLSEEVNEVFRFILVDVLRVQLGLLLLYLDCSILEEFFYLAELFVLLRVL